VGVEAALLIAQDEEGWRYVSVQSIQEMKESTQSEGSPQFSCSLSTILCAHSVVVPTNLSFVVPNLDCSQVKPFRKLYNL
jgi:hypothetical protein